MRVLIAPDKFAGTLSAVEAATAIATGWARAAPGDELDLAPMSDGGPGFLEVLHAALGGGLCAVTVTGPTGAPVVAGVLLVGATAYVESAQACGIQLTGARGAAHATSGGVGELVAAAVDAGARQVVVGLGGSGTNDGGAGALAALGAISVTPLDTGPAGLAGVHTVDLGPARERVAGVRLVAASDVDNPLTGPRGATRVFGPQKGLREPLLTDVDGWLAELAAAVDPDAARQPGAGAAGGVGFALLSLGGTRRPGVDLVAAAVGLRERVVLADLVLTGEGALDGSSGAGKVPAGVADLATRADRPCVVLAGRVDLGVEAVRGLGLQAAYSVSDLVGRDRALGQPAAALADLAEHVAGSRRG